MQTVLDAAYTAANVVSKPSGFKVIVLLVNDQPGEDDGAYCVQAHDININVAVAVLFRALVNIVTLKRWSS